MLERFDENAASPDNMELAYRLFDLNTHLEMRDYMPITPQLCVFRLEKRAIKSFQELGTKQCQDLNGLLSTGEYVLHAVAFDKHLKLINIVLKTDGMDVFVMDKIGQIMIHYAAQGGHVDMARYLIHSGLSIQALGDPSYGCFKGFTPLHYAVYEHQLDVIELLLERGARC
ncbi:hypothetical protein FHL15_002108 [Xylaria flabelliformis]|uniref:Uncharacterized protein n=1 Tax=Xylaria flabelliformis TaxID=2512241 RepID=A0A553I9E7_9PEZI|nr:hypothetical protein FHL15_002108 [Xylaria flabelliformis]